MSVIVTGGAGYIGGHVVDLLQRVGQRVVVVDDLSTGVAARVGGVQLERLQLATDDAPGRLAALMTATGCEAVVHLAADKQVGESVKRPAHYFARNVGGLASVLLAMEAAGVGRLVFSSSAATYGSPDADIVTEDTPTRPINPYGETKLAGEWMCRAAARAWDLRAVSLRYFNVAGTARPDLADTAVMNLVPIVLDVLHRGQAPVIHGDDYDTADGTCIRDYVHVADLAEAHVVALDALAAGSPPHDVYNVGTGTGASVYDVLAALGEARGEAITAEVGPRRSGDPARLVADVSRIEHDLGWTASRGLPEIAESAVNAWRPSLPTP